MKKIVFVFAGWALLSTGVYGAETLDMDAVKKLLTGINNFEFNARCRNKITLNLFSLAST